MLSGSQEIKREEEIYKFTSADVYMFELIIGYYVKHNFREAHSLYSTLLKFQQNQLMEYAAEVCAIEIDLLDLDTSITNILTIEPGPQLENQNNDFLKKEILNNYALKSNNTAENTCPNTIDLSSNGPTNQNHKRSRCTVF